MVIHPPPPFDPWLAAQAWQQTWLASVEPQISGRWWQQQRLTRLIHSTMQGSPLYARRSCGAKVLQDFEPVGKAELMAHFDDWATERDITRTGVEAFLRQDNSIADAWLGRYLVWTSSGSTGEPGVFVQDAASLAAYDAIDTLRLRPTSPIRGDLSLWGMTRRFAYVGALGGPYAGHVNVMRLKRIAPPWASPLELLSVLDPIDRIAQRLQDIQPEVLITYPSCAAALAQCQREGRLSLRLAEIWLGGEQLSAAQREGLREAFGACVRNSYGASEFYSIAFECALGRLHLNHDWVLLEPVDERLRPVAPGEFSHTTLLTNLANQVQPLVRYQLSDCVRFTDERCACGCALPVIEVQGRADDTLELPGARGGRVALLPLALESVIEEGTGITRFQLLRRTDGVLELRLAPGLGAPRSAFERCARVLQAWFVHQGVKPPRLVQCREPPLQHPGSGKLRRVVDLQVRR